MKLKFRSRTYGYLLLLLGLFVFFQSAIYTGVEYANRFSNPNETFRDGMIEVLQGMGLMMLWVPVMVGIAWVMARQITRPLHLVATTARRIREGHWRERIETATMPDDETRVLADALNAAFDGYADALRRMEHFSGDAAHQMRSPIAAMRNQGEVALNRSRTAEDYRETLETMLGELDRLARMVEQLLQLSRLDAGTMKEKFAAISVASVIEQVRQIYSPVATERGVDLVVAIDAPHAHVVGSEELLVELLGNLTDNALRHTPKGGVVRMEVIRKTSGKLHLSVTDSGPGISEEFAWKIFDRFVQVPGGSTGASGLGLSLAAQIATVHGGTLRLVNPGRPGAQFVCQLCEI